MTAAAPVIDQETGGPTMGARVSRWTRDNAWTIGLLFFLALLLVLTKIIEPTYSASGIQGLLISCVPLGLAAVAQAVVVISGGIDLSIGSQMALTSIVAAVLMQNQSEEFAVVIALGVLVLGMFLGLVNGLAVVITKVPDIVVTLAMAFVWAGFALLVKSTPGGAAAQWLKGLILGSLGNEWIPKSAVLLVVLVAVVWIPLSRSRIGLSLYAVGSSQLAAFRSGVSVGRTKLIAYTLTGLFSAMAGMSLNAGTGIGTPVPGPYTLFSVAAIVLGGVSLAGGRGGVFGAIVAVVILQLIKNDLTFLNFNSNLALVSQGVILIGVVAVGSYLQMRRSKAR